MWRIVRARTNSGLRLYCRYLQPGDVDLTKNAGGFRDTYPCNLAEDERAITARFKLQMDKLQGREPLSQKYTSLKKRIHALVLTGVFGLIRKVKRTQ